jgi:hypothetical protein
LSVAAAREIPENSSDVEPRGVVGLHQVEAVGLFDRQQVVRREEGRIRIAAPHGRRPDLDLLLERRAGLDFEHFRCAFT